MAKAKAKPQPQTIEVSPPERQKGSLKRIAGSNTDAFNNTVAGQALSSLWTAHSDKASRDAQYEAVIAGMMGIKPVDELEGMLAAQLVATHNAAMECYRRSMIEGQTFEGRREALNQANKLVRSYATLIEALNRHRGKGQQRVTVEHVHVHQGGQAIVGTVQGGGVSTGTEGQPHAPGAITYEPGQALPSEVETVREAVPSARG